VVVAVRSVAFCGALWCCCNTCTVRHMDIWALTHSYDV